MMHIPLTDVQDRQELYRLIERRPFCMSISAHTHRHEHRMIGQEDGWLGPEPHHHVINVTVSGSWWAGAKDERGVPHTIMADGAPNGYSILSFDGNQYRLDFRAAGRPKDYQMSVHAPELVEAKTASQTFVYANVFNGSDKTSVEMRVGDGAWRKMEKVWEEDPFYRQLFRAELAVLTKFEQAGARRPWTPLNGSRPSAHLWKLYLPANPPTGTQLIQVRASDADSTVYHGRRVVRIQ
jgi:hypothetical protein